MVKRPAIILLIILALVIGGYFIIKNRSGAADEALPTATPASMLVQESEHGNLTLLEIKDNSTGDAIQLKRFSDGNWSIVEPYEGAADQGTITAAETQLFALKILSSLETAADFSVLGLSKPSYIISLNFADGSEETIQVGAVTPTGSGYYVQRNGKVYVISTYSIDAILGLVNNPPYLATLTPSPQPPTSTPLPSETDLPGTATDTPQNP
jgi:hypothetical protein